ncbi:unnamed protein product [Owenia fusiformis]|uniref:NB-ARC domain-containing protein n=1 Tax=Owenia fusiformis TaxID=6347 RepID=A0A8S4N8X5_OWEFU|nr:unnamed protein product [Owenia fusiformis]
METPGGYGDRQCGDIPANLPLGSYEHSSENENANARLSYAAAEQKQEAKQLSDTADKAPSTSSVDIHVHDCTNVIVGPMGKINIADGAANDSISPVDPDDQIITNITNKVIDFKVTAYLKSFLDHMENHNFVILTGMSGIGKTEIAKSYWHLKKGSYDVGWLIQSNTDKDLRIATLAFLEKLDSIEIKVIQRRDDSISNLLQNIHSEIKRVSKRGKKLLNYLLIFDDVGDETHRAIVHSFKPDPSKTDGTNNISVILTTQLDLLLDDTLELVGFTKKEVLDFLSNLKEEDEDKITLWKELSHLPSALTCAKFDIKDTNRSIKYYLSKIKEKKLYRDIEQRDSPMVGLSYDKSPVGAHVKNAKAMIDGIASANKPLCFVLKTMGFFDSKAIPEFILRDILRQKYTDDEKQFEDEHIDHHIDNLLSKMRKRSYVTRSSSNKENNDRFVDTHSMFQLGIRFAMDEDDHQLVLEMLMRVLLRYFAKDTRYLSFFRKNTRLIPHVEIVLQHVHKMGFMDITFDMKAMAIAMYDILGYSYTQKDYPKVAEEKLRKSVDMMYKSINKSEKELDRHVRATLTNANGDPNDPEKLADEKARFIYTKLQDLGDDLIENLVTNTVLNQADVNLMKSKVGEEKLPELIRRHSRIDTNTYQQLVDLELALPVDVMNKAVYLPELYASVFYSYGRMYFYKKERPTKADSSYIPSIWLASALCKIIKEKTKHDVLHSVLTQRNGLMYLYSEDQDEYGSQKIDEKKLKDLYKGKDEYKNLLERTHKEDWYQHGLLKVTKNDLFHQSICLEKIIFICQKILILETDPEKRKDTIQSGKNAINELTNIVKQQEKDKASLHKGHDIHIVTAKFYEQAGCLDEAYENYKKAIERCTCKSTNEGKPRWKKYGTACKGIMHVAIRINTDQVLNDAVKFGKEFLKVSPKEQQIKDVEEIQKLVELICVSASRN